MNLYEFKFEREETDDDGKTHIVETSQFVTAPDMISVINDFIIEFWDEAHEVTMIKKHVPVCRQILEKTQPRRDFEEPDDNPK